MINTIFATKRDMTQAWTNTGKRLPITKCVVDENIVVGKQKTSVKPQNGKPFDRQDCLIFEIGYGRKKLKNMTKPLREKIKQSGFSFGVKKIKGIRVTDLENIDEEKLSIGRTIELEQVLEVGDVVKVIGTSKGKGFAGVVKKYGFAGGPRTHGQRDRERSPGSIGAMTDPGRVWKGKKMPGRMGGVQRTLTNLTVVYIDPETKEVWLSGPVPGHMNSIIQIIKTGKKKEIELDKQASGLAEREAASKAAAEVEQKAKEEKKKAVETEEKVKEEAEKKSKKEEKSEKKAESKESAKKEDKKSEKTEEKSEKKETKEEK